MTERLAVLLWVFCLESLYSVMKFLVILSCGLFTDLTGPPLICLLDSLGNLINCLVVASAKGSWLPKNWVRHDFSSCCHVLSPDSGRTLKAPMWAEKPHYEKLVSTKETEESCKYIQIKAECSLGHTPVINSQPHVDLFFPHWLRY